MKKIFNLSFFILLTLVFAQPLLADHTAISDEQYDRLRDLAAEKSENDTVNVETTNVAAGGAASRQNLNRAQRNLNNTDAKAAGIHRNNNSSSIKNRANSGRF